MSKNGLLGVQAAIKTLRDRLLELGGDGDVEVHVSHRDMACIKAATWPSGLAILTDEDRVLIAGAPIQRRG